MTAPSPFSTAIPNWQTSWDSTSLGWFKKCPAYYKFKQDGWETAAKKLDLEFGGLYASAVERYAHVRASGADHDTACLGVVKWAMTETNGWETGDSYKNRYTLLRSLVWNFEDRLHSPFKTLTLANGRPAVELSFNFTAFDISDEPISLCGHLDEVVEADGDIWIKDDKTTKSALTPQYFQNYTPDNQMSLYTIAGQVILDRSVRGVLVRACQVAVGFSRFATAQVARPKALLDLWLREAQWFIQQARACAVADFWPKNDKSCFNCEFRKVCAVSPSHQQAWLEQDFIRREPWNPLKTRGEV